MDTDTGRVPDGPGLSQAEPQEGLGPSGFDPSREWTLWSEQRPTDPETLYRWRIPARVILGMMLRPEWSAKLTRCGMGYGEAEHWPPFSNWDGYSRTLPAGTEWRIAEEGEGEKDILWIGLELLPSPFTGAIPKVDYCGLFIGAPPYQPEWLKIVSYMIGFNSWKDAAAMQRAWNRRDSDGSPKGGDACGSVHDSAGRNGIAPDPQP